MPKKVQSSKIKPASKVPSRIIPLDPEQDIAQTVKLEDFNVVTRTAETLVLLQEKYDDLTSQLADLAEKIRFTSEESLPALMDKVGLKEMKLNDGNTVRIVPFLRTSLPSMSALSKLQDQDERARLLEKRESALEYLEKNGAASLIKNTVTADLGKDSKKLEAKVLATLEKLKVKAQAFHDVHPQTLKAWVKEKLESGAPLDHDLLSITTGEIAKLEGFGKSKKPSQQKGSKAAGPQLF